MEKLLLDMFGIETTPHTVGTVHRFLRARAIMEHDKANDAPALVQQLNATCLVIHKNAFANLADHRKAA